METQIKGLEELLNLNGKIKRCSEKNLTAPGDNYGSQMLSLEVELNNSEKLNLVAKLVPPSEFMKKIFNTQVTFKKEVCFYKELIPALQNFQKERGCSEVIDFIPKYYGARFNNNAQDSDLVDDDACLVLENIKLKGYDLGDRLKGFDLDTAKFLIRDLATLHAVAIGLKLTHPDIFRKLLKPYLQGNFDSMPHDVSLMYIEGMVKYAKQNDKTLPYVKKMESLLTEQLNYYTGKSVRQEENIFSTIIHCDFWVNNMMVLKNEKGEAIKNAMLDFQLISYGNPGHDIVFFIYSSLSEELIKNHYDTLVEVYHKKFLETLEELKVDNSQFTFESLQKEIYKAATKLELYHILFMHKPILTEKGQEKELKDQDESTLLDLENTSDLFKSKVYFTILDFVKKGWL